MPRGYKTHIMLYPIPRFSETQLLKFIEYNKISFGEEGRMRSLSRVSRKQRYNTLDFPAENRVPTGMLAPLLETQRQRDVPFEIPHFLRRRICKLQKQQLENKKTLQSSPYNWTKIAAFYHTQCKQKVGSHFNSIDIRYPISTNITITER